MVPSSSARQGPRSIWDTHPRGRQTEWLDSARRFVDAPRRGLVMSIPGHRVHGLCMEREQVAERPAFVRRVVFAEDPAVARALEERAIEHGHSVAAEVRARAAWYTLGTAPVCSAQTL